MREDERATTLLLQCISHDGASSWPVGSFRQRNDARQLLALAERHGVIPILYRRLIDAPQSSSAPDAETERQLRSTYHHSRLRARATRAELAEVLLELSTAGIPIVALKGAYLAEHVYGDEALRPMLDLDLLVPDDRTEDASRVVLGLGYAWDASAPTPGEHETDYSTHHHLRRLMRRGRLPVELHRAIAPPDRPWVIDTDDLWRRAQPARIAGVDVLALSSEHLLLHLVVHAASHEFTIPLLAIEDIARVAERLAPTPVWPRFIEVANRARLGGTAYATLVLARRLLAARIPDAALQPLEHERRDHDIVPSLARAVLEQFTALPVSYELALLQRGAWARFRTLMRGILPSTARLRAEHGLGPWSPVIVWHYLRRPFDLARRHWRSLGTLLVPRRHDDDRGAVVRWLRGGP